MKILAIANQKGGPGKTTISLHLAYFLLERQKKVVFVDLDPSGDATSTLLQGDIILKGGEIPLSDVQLLESVSLFKGEAPALNTDYQFTLFQGTKPLIDIGNESIQFFADNINFVNESFDDDVYCIIDGGPTAGVLQFATLVVSQYLAVPIELDKYSLNATTSVSVTLENIREYNPDLEFLGVIPNRVYHVSPAQKALLQQLQTEFADTLLGESLYISQRQAVRDALDNNQPVWSLKKESARLVGKEILAIANTIFAKMGLEEAQP
ncbi:Chromosome (plasmid) partitioning protein ParA [Acinetobacter junii CIP 107470 = MTCC 11364]|uniref:Chromosome (Plasmid) partitioning protein ParA n=1 Tax=Acinetobacter junii CIP 107470 = MTCC 11364 TaxID=1217666 RepID=S7WRM8_ACIJU|nr:ParA family protein [Acinetobacter junii]ENV52043.1 hypothetical protein F953_00533 [Acinetobacter junii CIP 107470 = MTCC 11364]EPR85831.1 Chromosome (plasmid) partitioning protein ParA [Acinetobacter junii CIP 107470 = MTCC 11364]